MKLLTTLMYHNTPVDFYEAKNDMDVFWLTAEQIGDLLGYRHPERAAENLQNRCYAGSFAGLCLDNIAVNVRRRGLIKTTVYNFDGAVRLCELSSKNRADDIIDFLRKSKDQIIARPKMYKGKPVRTIKNQNGLWFVAKDVCDILELTNPTEALKALDDNEKSSLRISEGTSPKGGNPNMNVISESGLYALIMRSNKPEAKKFRKWVTSEVLPSIRKTGRYDIRTSKFYSGVEIAKALNMDLYDLEIAAVHNGITSKYGYIDRKDANYYFTEEGRDALMELLK